MERRVAMGRDERLPPNCESRRMPLSVALLNVFLSRACPSCGHKLVKKGSWFQTIGSYACEECKADIRMSYEAKVTLFDAHAHLVDQVSP